MMKLHDLRIANNERCIEWMGHVSKDMLFSGVELANEVGELLDVIKKIYRHQQGWKGGIDPNDPEVRQHLREEFGDVQICLDLLANIFDVDLEEATVEKFNKTSQKHSFKTRLHLSGRR